MFVIPGYQPFYRKTIYQNFGNPGHQYVNWWTHVIKGLHKNDFVMARRQMKYMDKGAGSYNPTPLICQPKSE